MMRTRVVAVLALVGASCGPDPGPAPGPQPPPPPQPQPQPEPPNPAEPPATPVPVPLSSAFNGTWVGRVALAFPAGTLVYSGAIVIAVSGTTATVSGICPGGSGTITSEGSGRSAEWQGSHTCPAVGLGFDCRAITLVHQHATMTLEANILTALATGVGTGCGRTVAFTMTFESL